MTLADVRWAATSPAQAATARTAKAAPSPTSAGTVRSGPSWSMRTSWTIGTEQHGLGHQGGRPHQSHDHGAAQVAAGRPGASEQAGVDRPAVDRSGGAQGVPPSSTVASGPVTAPAPLDVPFVVGPTPVTSTGSPGRRTRARKTQ